jgi:hypothetical protein
MQVQDPPPPNPDQKEKLQFIESRDDIVEQLFQNIQDLADVEYNLGDLYLISVILSSVVEKYKVHLLEGEPIENNPWKQNLKRLESYVKKVQDFYTAGSHHQSTTRGQLFTFIHNVRSAKTTPELNRAVAEFTNFNIQEDLYCYADKVASCRNWSTNSVKLIRQSLPLSHPIFEHQIYHVDRCESILFDHCWKTLERLIDCHG